MPEVRVVARQAETRRGEAMSCRWNGLYRARTLPGHHEPTCTDAECSGCQPCTEIHCAICGRVHVDAGACPECVSVVRDDLLTIATLCDALPEEAESRGVMSEAAMLWGPTADPEAWNFRKMSALAGRVDPAWLEDCRDEQHPLWVLGTWERLWREHLDQPTDLRATLPRLVDYLNRQMHVMAGNDEVAFDEFAREIRGCRGYLEDVLRDGEQRDTGAPCMRCEKPLVRVWGASEDQDGWMCPRCRERSSEDQYRFAVMHLHREEAEWLTDRDMELRTGVKAGTVRSWARETSEREPLVRKKRDSGRTLYAVVDVMATAKARGLVA